MAKRRRSVTIRKFGKARRLTKAKMQHKPSGKGKGKWHSRTTLWGYKVKSRRLRKIAADSRRRNRA